jgi:hypothetical protein
MPQQEDYILRMIRLSFQVVQRLRARLLGGPAEADEVVREARDAQGELLGPMWEVIARVDADTAVGLIRDRERLEAWAELLRVEAEGLRLGGDEAGAAAAARRAEAILEACGRLLG